MQFEVRQLCEKGKFSEAIKFASELSDHDSLRVNNLNAIEVEILKQNSGSDRDIFLGQLFFAFAKIGGFDQAMKLLTHFSDLKTVAALNTLISRIMAHREESIRLAS